MSENGQNYLSCIEKNVNDRICRINCQGENAIVLDFQVWKGGIIKSEFYTQEKNGKQDAFKWLRTEIIQMKN